MTQHEIQRELQLILEGIRQSTDSLWVDTMEYTMECVLIKDEIPAKCEEKLAFEEDENGEIEEVYVPYQATDWLNRLKALTTILSSDVKIQDANYLTPGKAVVDSWNHEEAFAWINGMQMRAFHLQGENRDTELQSTKQAIRSVINYLEATGRI